MSVILAASFPISRCCCLFLSLIVLFALKRNNSPFFYIPFDAFFFFFKSKTEAKLSDLQKLPQSSIVESKLVNFAAVFLVWNSSSVLINMFISGFLASMENSMKFWPSLFLAPFSVNFCAKYSFISFLWTRGAYERVERGRGSGEGGGTEGEPTKRVDEQITRAEIQWGKRNFCLGSKRAKMLRKQSSNIVVWFHARFYGFLKNLIARSKTSSFEFWNMLAVCGWKNLGFVIFDMIIVISGFSGMLQNYAKEPFPRLTFLRPKQCSFVFFCFFFRWVRFFTFFFCFAFSLLWYWREELLCECFSLF